MNKMNLEFKAYDKKENVMCKVGLISFDTGGCFLIGNSPTHDEYMDNGSIIEGPKEGNFVKFEDLELLQLTRYKGELPIG